MRENRSPSPKTVLIVGTGRTGSTYLADFCRLNLDSCLALHQPRRSLKLLSNRHLSGTASAARMVRALRRWADAADARMQATRSTILVQSDPWLFGFTPYLEQVFEHPHVIHLVRHPLTYVPSQLNRFYREAWTGLLRNLIPYWRLRGDLLGDYSRQGWRRAPEEEKTAWYWACCNRFIIDNRHGLDRFLTVKCEDVFGDDRSGLKRIIDFCGFDLDLDRAREPGRDRNYSPSRFEPARQWSPEVRTRVLEICQPLMAGLGYAQSQTER